MWIGVILYQRPQRLAIDCIHPCVSSQSNYCVPLALQPQFMCLGHSLYERTSTSGRQSSSTADSEPPRGSKLPYCEGLEVRILRQICIGVQGQSWTILLLQGIACGCLWGAQAFADQVAEVSCSSTLASEGYRSPAKRTSLIDDLHVTYKLLICFVGDYGQNLGGTSTSSYNSRYLEWCISTLMQSINMQKVVPYILCRPPQLRATFRCPYITAHATM